MAPTPTSSSDPARIRSPSSSNPSIPPPTAAPIEEDVKRKHGLDTSLILSEPRKRKRESTDGVGAALAAGTSAAGVGGGVKKKGKETHYDEPAVVWEQGMKLLDVVRAATEGDAPDGRLIATDFLKLPNRRLYPDYYEIIKAPIALDDIEAKIRASEYPSFEAVEKDIEHCFVNAKRYNVKGSIIFSDAKVLHKLTKTTYSHLVPLTHPDYKAPPSSAPSRAPTPPSPPPPPPPADSTPSAQPVASTSTSALPPKKGQNQHTKRRAEQEAALAAGSAAGGDGTVKKGQNQHTKRREAEERARQLAAEASAGVKKEEKTGGAKGPNVWKGLKAKLDKVTSMKEKDTGREIAFEFMDLISKSEYPDYYRIIQKPMSFNLVYQKLKRKDYESADELADDVDLIFSNALVFNMDESQIAIDAKALKAKFHSLVDELLTSGRTAPAGQAKVGPLSSTPSATLSKLSASKTAAAGVAGEAGPASIAKIKIRKKVKPEDQVGPSTAVDLQLLDVDDGPRPPAELDPGTLSALQELLQSEAYQLASSAGQQPGDADASGEPPKKMKRAELRALAKREKELKRAAAAAGIKPASQVAVPAQQLYHQQHQQQSFALTQPPVPSVVDPSLQPALTPVALVDVPPPRVKQPALIESITVGFPGSTRRAVVLSNARGIKAHALSVREGEISLVLDVRAGGKGKGRLDRAGDDEGRFVSEGGEEDVNMTPMELLGDGGDYALDGRPTNALARLFSIQLFSNGQHVYPEAHSTTTEEFTISPPAAFHLPLVDPRPTRPGLVAPPGSWLVELAVAWKDVDQSSGTVLEAGSEAYDLFIRR